jgi:hypothetical protein
MKIPPFTRRRFLASASATASLTVLGKELLAPQSAFAAPAAVRRDVGNLTASHSLLVNYGKAITAMKALPSNDPLSWDYQAAIHGTTLSGSFPAWRTCEHGTYFFWSWHRMYLYYFEKIIRKMSGDCGWTIPYWNWKSLSQRQVPAPFRDSSSPLFATRRAEMNDGTGSLTPGQVNYDPAMLLTSFSPASSGVEAPHGAIHGAVGGLMCCVSSAAGDPVFYLHHCNIDRIWNLWLGQGGGRSNPIGDATWKNTQFTFVDENGALVKLTGCDVLRCAEQLNYVYEEEPPQVNQYCLRIVRPPYWIKRLLYRIPIPPIKIGPDPVEIPLDLRRIEAQLSPRILESRSQNLILEMDGIEADKQPEISWEVYIGLPQGAKPDPEGPHFVGIISLFGAGIRSGDGHHKFTPARAAFPLSRALRAAGRNLKPEAVMLTIVPSSLLIKGKLVPMKPAANVTIVNLSISAEVPSTKAPPPATTKPIG